MANPKVIAYLKPVCGWSGGVRAVLAKYGLEYEDRDVINNPNNYREMVMKSGQPYSLVYRLGMRCWPMSAVMSWKVGWSQMATSPEVQTQRFRRIVPVQMKSMKQWRTQHSSRPLPTLTLVDKIGGGFLQ